MPETMGGNLHSLIDLANLVLWNSVVLHIGKWKLVLYAFGAILKREGSKPLHLAAGAKQTGIEVEGSLESVLPHEPDHPFVLFQSIIKAEREILFSHAMPPQSAFANHTPAPAAFLRPDSGAGDPPGDNARR